METRMMECRRHGLTEHVFYSGRYRCKKCYTWYNAEKRKRYKNILVENEQEIFKGWMFSSNPALSAMEHPVYDIWIVECKDKNESTTAPVPVVSAESEPDEVNTEDLED